MDLLRQIAENQLSEALPSGEFDHLRCSGERIGLSGYCAMPPAHRAAFHVLSNAGFRIFLEKRRK